MYVCICNGVTDHEIRAVAAAGCTTLAELTMRTGCGATCGCRSGTGTCSRAGAIFGAAIIVPAGIHRTAFTGGIAAGWWGLFR